MLGRLLALDIRVTTLAVALLGGATGCAGRERAGDTNAPPRHSSSSESTAPQPETGHVLLPAGATFGDLVAASRQKERGPSDARCLLRGGAGGAASSFEAFHPPPEPLAPAPADLDEVVSVAVPFPSAAGPRLVASWGETAGGGLLDVVAFSPVPRAVREGATLIFVLTDRGRYIGMAGHGSFAPFPASDEPKLREVLPEAAAVIVTAERDVPIERLRKLLDLLSSSRNTTVVLGAVRAAAAPPANVSPSRYDYKVAPGTQHACDLRSMGAVTGEVAGRYAVDQLAAVQAAFDASFAKCRQRAETDGTIHVLARILPDGTVEKACAETDDTGDADARACVVEALHNAEFPPPESPGVVPFGTAAVFRGRTIVPVCG